jgi:hypothetical protein
MYFGDLNSGGMQPLDLGNNGPSHVPGPGNPFRSNRAFSGYGDTSGLPTGWDQLFVKLQRNWLRLGDTDASIKAKTGLEGVVTQLQSKMFDAVKATDPGRFVSASVDHLDPRGDYGLYTVELVEAFQVDQGIKKDGLAGRNTLEKLYGVKPARYSSPSPPIVDPRKKDADDQKKALAAWWHYNHPNAPYIYGTAIIVMLAGSLFLWRPWNRG